MSVFPQGVYLNRDIERAFHYALVVIQFGLLFVLAISGPILTQGIWRWVELSALALGGWAIVAMRVDNFNITPAPKSNGQLTQRGPYRWIRHPMYSALLLLGMALVGNHFTWLRLLLWFILVIDIVVKLTIEERLLRARFPGYAEYHQQTWRLIPFLY